MELRIDIDYNQILRLIHQLPKREVDRLTNTLQSEILSKKSSGSIKKIILKAPTWSDSDFTDYNETRAHLNKSRIA
ncbi:MAG: hypothetical protein NT144_03765 [Bacteroidia bacterium]|nr:hypothetical protein [Bacteroidia bacterium]